MTETKTVPVEPTREMLLAMQSALLDNYPEIIGGEVCTNARLETAIYAAAVAAAPSRGVAADPSVINRLDDMWKTLMDCGEDGVFLAHSVAREHGDDLAVALEWLEGKIAPSPQVGREEVVVKRSMAGETVNGIKVAAWREAVRKPKDCSDERWAAVFPHGAGHAYAEHWSTLGEGAERLFTEDAILSLINGDQREEGDGWQDISTAPRDGTIILVAITVRGDQVQTAYEARWNEEHGCFSGRNGFLLFDGATHWRPLPPPPSPTTEG